MGIEPTSTGLQPVAWPSGSSVTPFSIADFRFSICKTGVTFSELLCNRKSAIENRKFQYPAEEPQVTSNPVLQFRRLLCCPAHSQGKAQRADDWIRASMCRFTRSVPFCVEPRRRKKQERKDLYPVRRLWRPPALPGALSCTTTQECLAGIEPVASTFTGSHASRYTTDTIQRKSKK